MPSRDQRRLSGILDEMQPGRLIQSIVAGLITGVLAVLFAITFAGLLFSGELSAFLPQYIGIMLVGTTLVGVVLVAMSSYPAIVNSPQDFAPVILAGFVLLVQRQMAMTAPLEAIFLTAVIGAGITTIVTGGFFLLIGFFRLGGLVRYIPYPVIGGFLAGTGWLLLLGGLSLMAETSFDLAGLVGLVEPAALVKWIPGLLLGVLLLLVGRRFQHYLVLPGSILAAIALFYGIAALAGQSYADLGAAGWTLGPFPQADLWQPIRLSQLAGVDWGLLITQSRFLVPVMLVNLIALLLNANALELLTGQDFEINRELRAAGLGNLLAGFSGSLITFHAFSLTALGHTIGARGRLVGLVAAGVSLVTLLFGANLVGLMPKFILGGLSVLLGLNLLIEWVYTSWKKLPGFDYFIVLGILIIIAAVGFLEGVGVGILAAVILFLFNYSRTEVVKFTASGDTYASALTRPRHERRLLGISLGKRIYILELQGYIFFGTANQLLERIRTHLENTEQEDRFVLLDFDRVTGIDSSVAMSFQKLERLARRHRSQIVLTGLSATAQTYLRNAGVLRATSDVFLTFPDIDRGVEWCEEAVLRSAEREDAVQVRSVVEQIREMFGDPEAAARLEPYLDKLTLSANETLIRQGEQCSELYFIESGRVTAQLEAPNRPPQRLQSMTGDNVVGEVGFYLDAKRTASVIADEDSVIYRLTHDSLIELEQQEPVAAVLLHKFLAHLMAERVAHLTQAIRTVKH